MSNNTAIDSMETSIIEGLTNEDAITDLLEYLCIDEDIEKIKLIETYDCNNEHTGLIVEGQDQITCETESIIIDAVIGYPVTEQVYETVYKKGSNCDKRIIIYTEGLADLDTYGGENDDAIKNLVENLNTYGINIFLVKVNKGSDKEMFTYRITAIPPETLNYKLLDLPSEAKLKEEEFWAVYYWQQFEDVYCPWKAFTGPLYEPRKFGHVYGPDGAELNAKWTEEGLIFEAIDENDESEYLEPIWDNRKHELQLLFPYAQIAFIMRMGKVLKLLVKIWPIPVQHLMDASVSEKKRLAKKILEEFGKFIDFITSPLDDIDNTKVDEVEESVELVETG